MDGDRGRFFIYLFLFFALELWSFRLYLGATLYTYFFWLMMYLF